MATINTGIADVDEFLAEARSRHEIGLAEESINQRAAEEDQEFFAGDQWDAGAIKDREGRPCLTINRMPQFVAQIVGDIRINRPSIKVRPAEDADKDLAEIREGLIRAIERQSGAQGVYSSAGQDQVVGGLGNFRVVLEYAKDDGFDQDIFIRRIADPFSVVWDPAILDPTGADANWLFFDDKMDRKAFEKAHPEATPGAFAEGTGWTTKDEVRITEYWTRKDKPIEIALMPDGAVIELTPENEGFRLQAAKVRKSAKTVWCKYLITGHAVLEGPVEYPITRPPFFRVPGWEALVRGRRMRWGLVRFAKDPQRLQNYWRSVAAEVLALQPRATWLLNTGQGGMDPDSVDDFRGSAKSGDPVLEYQGAAPPTRIDPPAFPAALVQEAALNAQDMKDVTGLHDASLGAKSNETSGKAILARQKEGDVASYIYHDNLQAAIRECGKVINELIPIAYDTARTIRVVGEDEATKVMKINDPNDPKSNITKGKYDIVVETGPSYSTKRVEAAESMTEFFRAVPAAAQFAGDLFALAQDWPMAEKIAERLKSALPPGMAKDEDEEKTPEQMQAEQMQAQQAQQAQAMQQKAMELDLDEKQAKVNKLNAEAANANTPQGKPESPFALQLAEAELRKAIAEADRAEAEAAKAHAEIPKVEAQATREHIGAHADIMDLERKPLEAAHSETDLEIKRNPPKEDEAA